MNMYEGEVICRWKRGDMVWRRGDMVWYVMKGDALKFKRSAHFEHWHFNCTMNRPTVMSFHYRHHFNIFFKTLLKMYFIFWKCVQEQQGFPLLIYATATAKSLQLCPTLCDHIDGSPPGSSVPGILQARILEWVAISFSNAWKWKVKVKSLSRVRLLAR